MSWVSAREKTASITGADWRRLANAGTWAMAPPSAGAGCPTPVRTPTAYTPSGAAGVSWSIESVDEHGPKTEEAHSQQMRMSFVG